MIKKRNLFSRPRKPFESGRIKEENSLVSKYGLKNKKEIWKSLAKINYFRKRAMDLAYSPEHERKVFIHNLSLNGFKVKSTTDVLGLKVEDILDRRLSTIVAKKGLAKTPKQARQMIVHRNILVDDNVVTIPGYIVSVEEENKIIAKKVEKKNPQIEVKEEIANE